MINWIQRKRNKKGFTLIELIVVIAILGILAALAIPRLSGSRHSAAKNTVESNLRTIDSAIMIAEADNKLPSTIKTNGVADLVTAGYLASEPQTKGASYSIVGDGTASSPYRAAVEIVTGDIGNFGIAAAEGPSTLDELQKSTNTNWNN